MKTAQPPSDSIQQIEFELEKAQHGMGMPYDAERVSWPEPQASSADE
jgi:hypothetical protein